MKNEQHQQLNTGEMDLLDRALRALAHSTGLDFKAEPGREGVGPDGYIVVPGTGARDESWPVKIKRYISRATVGLAVDQMGLRRSRPCYRVCLIGNAPTDVVVLITALALGGTFPARCLS